MAAIFTGFVPDHFAFLKGLKRPPKGFVFINARVMDDVKPTSFVVSKKLSTADVLPATYPIAVQVFAKDTQPLLQFGEKAMK